MNGLSIILIILQVFKREEYLYTFLNKNILTWLCFSMGQKLPSSLKSQPKALEII